MGMLIKGHWSNEDHIIKDGAYVRQNSVYNADLDNNIITNEPARFHLGHIEYY